MRDTLTKENFWDEMEQKYPKAMAHFKAWIDRYKSEHDWEQLFNGGIRYQSSMKSKHGRFTDITVKSISPKYHELPIAMQFGIFYQYMSHWRTLGDIISETGTICIESNIPKGMMMFVAMSFMVVEQKLGGGLVLP